MIKSILIYGTGIMGASMAQIFAQYGYETILLGRNDNSIQKALKLIEINQKSFVDFGVISSNKSEEIKRDIIFTTDNNYLKKADYIIETIVEDMNVKKEFFKYLSKTAKEDSVIVTNTSGLSINEMAKSIKNPHRFAGMHWINPPHIVPLIEIIKNDYTDDDTVGKIKEVCDKIHKKAVIVKNDCSGFIFNRLQYALLREAAYIVENGWASIEDVDNVVKFGLGMRYACIGPFRIADIGGLDTFNSVSKYLVPELSAQDKIPLLNKIVDCECGFGVKNGKGFYDYSNGNDKKAIAERDELFINIIKNFYNNLDNDL